MKTMKRVLALALAMSMVAGMFTTTAMAKESEKCPQIDYDGSHKHDLQYVLKEATCTEDGLVTYYCSGCKDGYGTDTEIIPKTGHVLEKVEQNKPTCTEKGNWVVRCKVCKQEFDHLATDPLKADFQGQKWEPVGNGRHMMVCKNCGGKAEGHSKTEDCRDKDGDGKCDDCGEVLKKQCGQVDEYGNHKVEKTVIPATCTEDGAVIYSCNECGYYEKEVLSLRRAQDSHRCGKQAHLHRGGRCV